MYTNVTILSKLYRDPQKRNGRKSLYVKSKWELEVNIKLSEGDWHSISRTKQNFHQL